MNLGKEEKGYMVLINEGDLEIKVLPFEDGLQPLYDLIGCQYIDHSSAIDYLTERDLDLWVDDEGMLRDRVPVFVFMSHLGQFSGYLVGNMVIQKHDNEGNSIGLSNQEVSDVLEWLEGHRVVEASDGSHQAIVIEWEESKNHRESIARTKKLFEEMGGKVIGG